MVRIKPGSFSRNGATVTLTTHFWMGKFEVTQAEYEAVVGLNPSEFPIGNNHPVEMVDWHDAVQYCESLTEREQQAGHLPDGFEYRLPTEAEWEYACRAGSMNAFHFGNDATALGRHSWNLFNSNGKHHPVGRKPPNAWGLHDMHGNVWEWCQGRFTQFPKGEMTDPVGPTTSDYRIYRGGGWHSKAAVCRSDYRYTDKPLFQGSTVGFRVVLAERPLFSFGAIADCQYCNQQGSTRRYNLSPKKLATCVEYFNTLDLAFVIHLGDFIDRDFESFEIVVPIYDRLITDTYHVLGNHDFSVADERKAEVPSTLGLDERYYDFSYSGFRFLVTDGNDISFHAHPTGSAQHQAAVDYYQKLPKKPPEWNGAMGPEQLAWMDQTLKDAGGKGQRAILFSHFPVFPKNEHNLWNDAEVISTIQRHNCVAAYINGHNHAGNYGIKSGVHYLTLNGMVDTEETAYAVIDVYPGRLKVTGFGREPNRVMRLNQRPKTAATASRSGK